MQGAHRFGQADLDVDRRDAKNAVGRLGAPSAKLGRAAAAKAPPPIFKNERLFISVFPNVIRAL
jgi:hypothetical protein